MADDELKDTGGPETGRPKREPPTIDLDASEVSGETRAAALQANGSEDQRASIAAALERLIGDGPTGMGTMLKAIGLSAPPVKELLGFES